MLDRFDEDPARVSVAGLGDGAQAAGFARRVLPRHQTKESHQMPGVDETVDIAEFGHEHGGRSQLEPAQTHQRLYRWIHSPLRHLHRDELLQPPSATAIIVVSEWTSKPTYLWIFIVLVPFLGCWFRHHTHADRLPSLGATRVTGDKHTSFPLLDTQL